MVGEKSSDKGLLVLPDIYGWNGGRIRNIADAFSSKGYFCVIPKLLVPCLDGGDGTDGDGFPPDFDLKERGEDFKPYMVQFPYAVLVPKVLRGLSLLGAQERIGVIGFCWGGWCLTHLFLRPSVTKPSQSGCHLSPEHYTGRNAAWW